MSQESFDQFKLSKPLLKALNDLLFRNPTLIQLKSIPAALSGQDIIGISQTGSGKTAAYLLPIITVLSHSQGIEPRALIIVPTRELVVQVENHFKELCSYIDLRSVGLYGGEGISKQKQKLSQGCDVIIATPARFLEHYSQKNFSVKKIKFFVLDEAERLLDKSFIKQLHHLLEVLPQKRQHFLFSATMSPLVRKISEDFIAFPHVIEIKPEEPIATNIQQEYYRVPNIKTKITLLDYLLSNCIHDKKTIVFCRSKTSADNVFKYLSRTIDKDVVGIIHGNKQQNFRVNAYKAMHEGKTQILVTTDVAARGIDLPDVAFVINFDMPLVVADYIHRIGRTGRMFNEGKAISFVNPAEEYYLRKAEKLSKHKIDQLDLPQSIEIGSTSREEQQDMAREIDHQKRKEDPNFKGAFHEKKNLQKSHGKKRR